MNFSDFGQNINSFVEGLSTFFIGIFVVFVTLVLLIFIMTLISKVVNGIEKVGNKEQVAVEIATEPIVPVITTPEPVLQEDLELVAVITAAIAMSLGTTSDQLQVRSLRKVERKML